MPLQRLVSTDAMAALARELHFPDLSGLYAAVGEGHVSARHVVQRLVALIGGVEDAEEELAERATPSTVRQRRATGDAGVVVSGADGDLDGLYTKLARCCTPVPGDEILGFVTRGGGVSVHRTDCTNAGDLQARAERLVDVSWSVSPASVFLVAIQVEALDRHRLLSRRHEGAGRREGQHPLGVGADLARPGRGVAVHVRDGRPQAPRAPAAGRAQRRGRLRRVPGDVGGLSRVRRSSAVADGGHRRTAPGSPAG